MRDDDRNAAACPNAKDRFGKGLFALGVEI
jgi:hypothetical protein